MQTTIDVSGLPESVVNDLRQLVNSLREQQSKKNETPLGETPEEWVKRLTTWAK